MKLAVQGGGYATATDALVGGNRYAAAVYESLSRKLAGCAAMAGDDSTSLEFAASYDEAARECLSALAEAVSAFGSLADLAAGSWDNHRAADALSTVNGTAADPGPSAPVDVATVVPVAPPSALGGDGASASGWAGWAVDLVQGFVWPNADTDRLLSAAAAWRTAAEGVDLLASYCDGARQGLRVELSSEIPVAEAVIGDLRSRIAALASQFLTVADACETYAAQVEEKRQAMAGLLQDLVADLAVGAVVAGGLSVLSGGLAAGAGGAAAGSRLASVARELHALVEALRMAAGGTAATLRPAAATAGETRMLLGRLRSSRLVAQMDGAGSAGGHLTRRWQPGWLQAHEHSGSHTMRDHVGKTNEQLFERLRGSSRPLASTFPDRSTAEEAVGALLRSRSADIEQWLLGRSSRLRLDGTTEAVTGRTAFRNGAVEEVHGLRAVLARDPSMPDGYRVLTAFPQP